MQPNDEDGQVGDGADDEEAHTLRDFLNTAASLAHDSHAAESADHVSALSSPCDSPPSRQSRHSSTSGCPSVSSPVYDRQDAAERMAMSSLFVPGAAAALAALDPEMLSARHPQWRTHDGTASGPGSGAHTPVSGGGSDLASIRRAVRKGAQSMSRSRTASESSLPGMKSSGSDMSRHWSAVRSAFASGALVRGGKSAPNTPRGEKRSPADKQWDMLYGVIQEGIASSRLRDVLGAHQECDVRSNVGRADTVDQDSISTHS